MLENCLASERSRLLLCFLLAWNITAQHGQTVHPSYNIVRNFYDGWLHLSQVTDFNGVEADAIECQINSCAEGGDDCQNKAQIDLPREFEILSVQRSTMMSSMRLGPYMAQFKSFMEKYNGTLSIEAPEEIAPVKGVARGGAPAYYCYTIKKRYDWNGGVSSREMIDTVWVKSSNNRISGIRNSLGGSGMVNYSSQDSNFNENLSIPTGCLEYYSLLANKRYGEAYDVFKRIIEIPGFSGHDNRGLIYDMSTLLSEAKVNGISSKVQKWLSLFYEAKYSPSSWMLVNEGYYKEDLHYLLQDSTIKYPFIHGLMPIYKNGKSKRGSALKFGETKYAFMNENGKMVTPYKYMWAEPFSKEYKVARVGLERAQLLSGRWEMIYDLIDIEGNSLVKNKYIEIRPFNNGLAAVRDVFYRWGFINTKGEEIVPPQYRMVTEYNCGWYGCCEGNTSYYMNLQGERINSESYHGVWNFVEGCNLACVSRLIDGKEYIGCIDSSGREVVPLEYYSISINAKVGKIILKKTFTSEEIIKSINDLMR